MPIRSLLPATIAALLCISLPAGGQDHAPDGARKTGTVAPTSVRVSFEEWTVPTPRSFPHDPLGRSCVARRARKGAAGDRRPRRPWRVYGYYRP
jgi:hypothetical protein